MKRALAASLLAAPVAVLGYGSWFARTHGTLHVWVTESDRPPAEPVAIRFLGPAGEVLAEAAGAPPHGTVAISSPSQYACADVERRAPFSAADRLEWDRCFERQSRWVPTWIGRVASVDVSSGSCSIRGMPVRVARHGGEWWLWWVPLPHVGGKPYTLFSVSIELDRKLCRPAR
jgi:hypothetical protein